MMIRVPALPKYLRAVTSQSSCALRESMILSDVVDDASIEVAVNAPVAGQRSPEQRLPTAPLDCVTRC